MAQESPLPSANEASDANDITVKENSSDAPECANEDETETVLRVATDAVEKEDVPVIDKENEEHPTMDETSSENLDSEQTESRKRVVEIETDEIADLEKRQKTADNNENDNDSYDETSPRNELEKHGSPSRSNEKGTTTDNQTPPETVEANSGQQEQQPSPPSRQPYPSGYGYPQSGYIQGYSPSGYGSYPGSQPYPHGPHGAYPMYPVFNPYGQQHNPQYPYAVESGTKEKSTKSMEKGYDSRNSSPDKGKLGSGKENNSGKADNNTTMAYPNYPYPPPYPPYGQHPMYGPPGMMYGHMMAPYPPAYMNARAYSSGGPGHNSGPYGMPTAGGSAQSQQTRGSSGKGIRLSLACDVEQLSDYQILVRQQLEIFEAGPEDVESNTQGRKKPVVLGQVGLRCKHCAILPLRARGRGAVYYPAMLQGVYQAAQNMAGSHLCQSCQHIPGKTKEELLRLKERRDNASGGKQYWADGCRALGIFETDNGLKMGDNSGC